MPKEGIVKCQDCDREFEGMLPDNKLPGSPYHSEKKEMDNDLVRILKEHHLKTRPNIFLLRNLGNDAGHFYYDVFLKNGGKGEILACSYYVIYTELAK